MRVLVVGGRGFIGSAIAEALAGHRVALLDRGDPAPHAVDAPDALDAIIFAQGQKSADPAELEATHVTLTRDLLARYAPRRAIYLSSGEVYGPAAVPFDEGDRPDPRTPYAAAKLRGEATVAASSGACSLRLGVVYGPSQAGAMFLPSLIAALASDTDFPMTAGEQTRDFVYVADVAALVARIVASDAAPPPVLNAATGRETPVREVALEVARLASRALGRDVSHHLRLGALPYRDSDQMRYALRPDLARTMLGWTAPTSLADGLARTVAAAIAGRA